MDHASTMRRLYELLSAGDIDGFREHVAEDFVEHDEVPGFEPSNDGVKQMFRMYIAAFPDLRMEAEDVLVSGDKVVARVRATGTQQGEFMGLPAPLLNRAVFRPNSLMRSSFCWSIVNPAELSA